MPHAGKVLGLARTDAPEGGKGKPCGESFIPKNHKCSKKAGSSTNSNLQTAAKVGLGLGIATGITAGAFFLTRSNKRTKTVAAVPKSSFAETNKKLSRTTFKNAINPNLNNFNKPSTAIAVESVQKNRSLEEVTLGHYLNTRDTALPHTASMMGDLVLELSKDSRADRAAVAKVDAYIRRHNVRLHPAALEYIKVRSSRKEWLNKKVKGANKYGIDHDIVDLHMHGLYVHGFDNDIFVRRVGFPGKINKGTMIEVANATERTLYKIRKINRAFKNGASITDNDEAAVYSMGYTKNNTAKDVLNYLHELGHSIHHKSKFDKPSFHMDSDAMLKWNMNVTEYGAENMREGFAEYFVAYVTAGKRLKKELPKIYDYIDSVVDNAIKARPIVHPPLPKSLENALGGPSRPRTYEENVKRSRKLLPDYSLSVLTHTRQPSQPASIQSAVDPWED